MDANPSRGAPDARARRRSPRDALVHPVNLVPIPVWILELMGRRYGFVADVSPWLLIGTLFLAQFASLLFGMVFPSGTARAKPMLHLALEMALIGLNIYVTGWGAVLAVGFLFAAVGHMAGNGSRLGRPAMAFAIAITGLGELAVALHIAPSLVPPGQTHGLAVLELGGVCAAIWIASFSEREKEDAEQSVRQSEERFRALVQHASDAIVVMEPTGRITYASPAVTRLLGYDADTLERFDTTFIRDDHLELTRATLTDILTRPREVTWFEVPVRHANGEYRWFEIGVTNRIDDPAVGGLVCNMRDVTERRSSQEQLTFQAHHDALTKLPNRWLLLEKLEQVLRDAAVHHAHTAVLFLDVDRFKLVNDSLGHDVGDRMLVTIAERLSACVRPRDVVARFGGDEFAVLLCDIAEPEVALRVADRVVEVLRDPIRLDGHELFVSGSVGIALTRDGNDRAADLLQQADLAMYVAKEKGRARWELFDPTLAPHVVERLELEGDMWRALDAGELVVQFQPEVALRSGQVIATEALLRWMHPRKGLLDPEKFVPLAEESSLIVAIDRLVLRTACAWARRWNTEPGGDEPFVVSVNLSPRFLRQADAVGDITDVLYESGVDPRCIQIEMTERTALTDLDTTCSQLHQLRAIGVRVAIDDFGTGYSSLSYLRRLPIDVLKLDKSFVDGLDAAPADLAIVQAIVTMGHALAMKVTAEGVERVEQVARLRELGCDSAMGWLWSPSVPPEQLWALVADGFTPEGGRRSGVVVPLRARAQ